MNDSRDPVAHIFNSAVAASAIGAAWEVGILDVLNEDGVLTVPEFAAERGLDVRATLAVVRALAAVDIVETRNSKVVPADHFAEVYRTRSFFHWLVRGSAEVFRRMPDMLPVTGRTGQFYRRDSVAIAFACREMNTF